MLISKEGLILQDETSTNHGGYGAALFDPRWKAKRQVILERDGRRCVICSSSKSLQVHHRQYHFSQILNIFKEPWDYPNKLLITLCKSCHQRGHKLYKVPTKVIK